MDFIAKLNSEPNNNWIFLFSILLLAYISLIKYRYYYHFILIIKSVYSEKNANNFLREASGFFQKFNLMPVFIVSCALIFISNDQSMNRFCKVMIPLLGISMAVHCYSEEPEVSGNAEPGREYIARKAGMRALESGVYEQAEKFFQQYKKDAGEDSKARMDAGECLAATYIRLGLPAKV